MIDLSVGSVHFKVAVATLGWVAAGVFLFLFFRVGGGSSDTAARDSGTAVVTLVHTLVDRHTAYVRQSAVARKQLHDSLDRITAAAKELAAQGASLAASARSAEQMREAGRVLAQANTVCLDGLTLCRHRGDSLATVDSVHQDSLAHGLQRAAFATQQILTQTECHLIHVGPIKAFGCPSRLVAFKVGVVGGITVWEVAKTLLTGKF